MVTDSQRDVVFTPFMLRVRAEFEGGDVLVPLRVRSSELRTRLKAVIWQELAALAPPPLADFLDCKYGISGA